MGGLSAAPVCCLRNLHVGRLFQHAVESHRIARDFEIGETHKRDKSVARECRSDGLDLGETGPLSTAS